MRGGLTPAELEANFLAREGEIVVPNICLTDGTPCQAEPEDEIQQPPKSDVTIQRSLPSRWLVQDFTISQASGEECTCLAHSNFYTRGSEAEPSASRCSDEQPYPSVAADKPRSSSTGT